MAEGAGNTFIKMTGVKPGESLQEGHEGSGGWSEITDWSWEIEAETSFMKGGGASVGKPNPGTLSFTHDWDTSSTVMLQKMVAGTHFDEVVIHMLKGTGDSAGKPTLFFEVIMLNAYVTKVSTKAGSDGLSQDVELVFKEISLGYKAQTNKGPLEKSAIPFNWNIAEATMSTTKTSSF